MNITDELDEAIGDGVKTLAALRTIRAELGSRAALREEVDALQRRYEALRNKQDRTSLALWRAEIQAQMVAANHEREVRGLKRQIVIATKTIERTNERCDFWHTRAQNDGREHAQVLDRLAKTDAVLMELCQLLQLDPTGDVVAELRVREQARQRQLIDAVRSGLLTPGDALILVDHIGKRALFLGDRFDAAWIRFRADLRHIDARRQISPEVVATLEPSNPVRRWIEVHPCIPLVWRFNRELSLAPVGHVLHTLSDPDEVWALWT